jgi:hypothetical protein
VSKEKPKCYLNFTFDKKKFERQLKAMPIADMTERKVKRLADECITFNSVTTKPQGKVIDE